MWKFTFDWKSSEYSETNAYWLSRLAWMSYRERPAIEQETKIFWRAPEVTFYESVKTDAQCCTLEYPEGLLLAFRGTESLKDWKMNLKFPGHSTPDGEVHSGFWDALQSLWTQFPKTYSELERHQLKDKPVKPCLKTALQSQLENQTPIYICGHSLGGAMALLAGFQMQRWKLPGNVKGVYTWGQPRAAKESWIEKLIAEASFPVFLHFNVEDVVPRLPPCSFGYRHYHPIKSIYDEEGRLITGEARNKAEATLKTLFNPAKISEGVAAHSISKYVQSIENTRW